MKNLYQSGKNFIKISVGERVKSRFPKAHKVYTILKNGASQLTKETFLYLKLKFYLSFNLRKVNDLSLKDIEIIRQLPKDWKRVAPVIIVSAFPFLNYIALPLAYFYPQQLLCRQFWTQEQKLKFSEVEYLNRQGFRPSLYTHLITHIDRSLTDHDNVAKNIMIDFFEKAQKEGSLNLDEVFDRRELFRKTELELQFLTVPHLQALVELNNCQRVFTMSCNINLVNHLYWLNQSDKRLVKEDLTKLTFEFIYQSCFDRGINARRYSIEELIKLLEIWLKFSTKMKYSNVVYETKNDNTLMLHTKVLWMNNSVPRDPHHSK